MFKDTIYEQNIIYYISYNVVIIGKVDYVGKSGSYMKLGRFRTKQKYWLQNRLP